VVGGKKIFWRIKKIADPGVEGKKGKTGAEEVSTRPPGVALLSQSNGGLHD
jgi:hypothetical protein